MLERSALPGAVVIVVVACAIVFGALVAVGRTDTTALAGHQTGGFEQTGAMQGTPGNATTPTSTNGLTKAQAIEVAHAIAPQTIGREAIVAKSGPVVEVWEDALVQEWARGLAPETPVWYLFFRGEDMAGSIVLLHPDGRVIKVQDLR